MASGFVYALVNSSLPGLVKVGKTTRLPSERVAELSGATGVATPFIVAFEQYFSDCGAAEEFVHITLERQGLRQSSNREFFRAAPNEVIRIILDAPGRLDGPPVVEAEDTAEDDGLLSGDDLEPDLKLEGLRPSKPWDDLLEQAENHHYGMGDFIQDHQEALALYKDAARLGSLLAYERIGDLYNSGDLGREDKEKALSFYKEGAKRGNYYCYAAMACLFFGNNQVENGHKAFKLFITNHSKMPIVEIEEFSDKYWYSLLNYLRICIGNSHEIQNNLEMLEDTEKLIDTIEKQKNWYINHKDNPEYSEGFVDHSLQELDICVEWLKCNSIKNCNELSGLSSKKFIFEENKESFIDNVLNLSCKLPVLVAFFATWRNVSHKQFSWRLERIVRSFDGRAILMKIDEDPKGLSVNHLGNLGKKLGDLNLTSEQLPAIAVFWNGTITKLVKRTFTENEIFNLIDSQITLASVSVPPNQLTPPPNGISLPQSPKTSRPPSSVVLFGVAVTIVVIIGIFAVIGHF
ncbi:GIY-YIG nuclease family protein [Acidocella sp.]|uniref:GIY-YIG nuclease family protein n=1 Tax=Acidocella sp. TaxID=50710 RepID=UPI0017BCE586|nr:GIY-YIG nuclease family protein [Acidocella sp.]NNM56667.1 hypothetical protein [Acidocella sp.]